METSFTVIEIAADIIYFVLVGDKIEIDNLVEKFNAKNKDSTIKYVSARLGVPTSIACEKLQKILNKKLEIDTAIESAQCFTYAEGFNKRTYMLMILSENDKRFTLGFPTMELSDEIDPEDIIINWIKKRCGTLPRGIRRSIRPISLVGNDEDIIVYVAKLSKENKESSKAVRKN